MASIPIDDVREAAAETAELYHEFLRKPSLSLGLYTIPAGEEDPQSPHTVDEVYYVLSGSARFVHGDETYPVESGDCLYVDRGVDHRFVDVTERLEMLVFFAPPEGSLAAD